MEHGSMNATQNRSVATEVISIKDGIISAETLAISMKSLFFAILVSSVVGIVLGFCSVIVFSTRELRCPTSVYLVALNLLEIGCNILGILLALFGSKGSGKGNYSSLVIMMYGSMYLKTALRRTTYCYACLVSVERCIAVVFPLHAKNNRLIRNPLVAVIVTLLMTLTTHILTLFKYEIVLSENSTTNATEWKLQDHLVNKKNKKIFYALNMVLQLIFVYLALTVCLVSNIITSVSLRRYQVRRQRLFECGTNNPGTAIKDRNKTIVVFVSTFVLVFLALPINISSFVSAFLTSEFRNFGKEHNLYYLVLGLGTLSETLINCTGFLFYMTIGDQFRQTFLKLFCSWSRRKSHSEAGFGLPVVSSSINSGSRSAVPSTSDEQSNEIN